MFTKVSLENVRKNGEKFEIGENFLKKTKNF